MSRPPPVDLKLAFFCVKSLDSTLASKRSEAAEAPAAERLLDLQPLVNGLRTCSPLNLLTLRLDIRCRSRWNLLSSSLTLSSTRETTLRRPRSSRTMCSTIAPRTAHRIKKDLTEFFSDPAEEIFVAPDEDKVTTVHALIIGPKGTPYEGGFFYFYIQFPANYPITPPRVRLMTTGNGKVRFNPNLYACGKVCLSIIGTWPGPSWSPALNLKTVLLSIQSLMNEEPFYNEPGYFEARNLPGNSFVAQAAAYSARVRYDTLKVAVLDMVEDVNGDSHSMPQVLKGIVSDIFHKRVANYEKLIEEQIKILGQNGYEKASVESKTVPQDVPVDGLVEALPEVVEEEEEEEETDEGADVGGDKAEGGEKPMEMNGNNPAIGGEVKGEKKEKKPLASLVPNVLKTLLCRKVVAVRVDYIPLRKRLVRLKGKRVDAEEKELMTALYESVACRFKEKAIDPPTEGSTREILEDANDYMYSIDEEGEEGEQAEGREDGR